MGWTDKLAKFFLGHLTKKGRAELAAKVRRDSDKIVAADRTQYLTCLANEVAHESLQQEQAKSEYLTQRILDKMPTRKLRELQDEEADEEADAEASGEYPPLARHGG